MKCPLCKYGDLDEKRKCGDCGYIVAVAENKELLMSLIEANPMNGLEPQKGGATK